MVKNNVDSNLFNNNLDNQPELETEKAPDLASEIIYSRLENLQIQEAELSREIPAFNFLSPGQKILALENLEQSILGEIKEEALADYQSRFSGLSGHGISRFNLSNVGALGQNFWLGITKQYQIAKIEKAKSQELISGGLEMHKEVLTKLAEGLAAYGPEVGLDEVGDLRINYLRQLDNLNAEEIKLVTEFNMAATTLAQTPDEWRYETAKSGEQKKFAQADNSYEIQKSLVLNVLEEKLGGEGRAVLEMNKIESQVRLNQFLNSNPEVEAQLLKIRDQSLVRRVLTGVVAERGLYMGAGAASRTLATLGLGALGSVAVFGGVVAGAGIIGYFRSSARAKETIRQKDIMGRKGKNSGDELSKIFAKGSEKKQGKVNEQNEISFGLGEKINYLLTRLENEGNFSKRQELAGALKTRLEYTKKYLDNGAVDFGSKETRLGNQYNLMSSLVRAENYLDLVDNTDTHRKEVEERVEALIFSELDSHDRQLDQKRKQYIVKKARQGMVMSAGFATIGRLFAELISDQGDLSEDLNLDKQNIANSNSVAAAEVQQPEIAVEAVAPAPVSTSPNSQELVDYLTSDQVLKNNLDLKTAFLEQKITVNVLEKGQGIGNYVNVGRNTPVNFVQPDGSVEVHGAGEVYVHPGDRVIQTEDGQVYVIRDSGIEGTKVGADLSGETPEPALERVPAIKLEAIENDSGSYIASHSMETDAVSKTDTLATESYIEKMKNDSLVSAEKKPRVFGSIRNFFRGGRKTEEVPSVEMQNSVVDSNPTPNWEALPVAEREIYENFDANISLYGSNPELAIANLLGQNPAEIIQTPGSTEIIVSLDNGHTMIFDMEEDQIIMNLDDGDYSIVTPENIVSMRKLIQSDNSAVDNLVGPENTNEVVGVVDASSDIWSARPDIKTLDFNHNDFTPEKEIEIQNFYNQRLEVLNEIKEQYGALKLKYGNDPKFAEFESVIRTYYKFENEKVKNIIEGSQKSSDFIFPIDEAMKSTKTPEVEVSERIERIVSQTGLK